MYPCRTEGRRSLELWRSLSSDGLTEVHMSEVRPATSRVAWSRSSEGEMVEPSQGRVADRGDRGRARSPAARGRKRFFKRILEMCTCRKSRTKSSRRQEKSSWRCTSVFQESAEDVFFLANAAKRIWSRRLDLLMCPSNV